MPAQLAGRSILVVEDEPIIAMDIVAALRAAGASVAGARTLKDAMTLVDCPGLSAAIVDHGLHEGDSSAVCDRLKARGVPFLLYTGYKQLEGPCSDGEQVRKPAPPDALVAALVRLLAGAPASPARAGRSRHYRP